MLHLNTNGTMAKYLRASLAMAKTLMAKTFPTTPAAQLTLHACVSATR